METIVCASSNPSSIVLDCFCGSGTTLVASEKLGRKWIGIDQSDEAIKISELKLSKNNDLFSNNFKKYEFVEYKLDK